MKVVNCCDCGSELEVPETRFVAIPKYRCDSCLKKR